jgi:hypothetical protein
MLRRSAIMFDRGRPARMARDDQGREIKTKPKSTPRDIDQE